MDILPIVPRGFCKGVVRAIQIAEDTVQQYPHTPITMLGMIVHNRYVVDRLAQLGIACVEDPQTTRLELLDQVESGVVIFTAHGVSDAVQAKALAKGLTVVDATCEDVLKTHQLVQTALDEGRDVFYVGKHHHPEAEAIVALSPHVHLIEKKEDLVSLNLTLPPLLTNQTTMSIRDTYALFEAVKAQYPQVEVASEICDATRLRQEAVLNLPTSVDLLIVVGDPASNNTAKLKEAGHQRGIPDVIQITGLEDLTLNQVKGKQHVAITSGASTPTFITEAVIQALQTYAATGTFPSSKKEG